MIPLVSFWLISDHSLEINNYFLAVKTESQVETESQNSSRNFVTDELLLSGLSILEHITRHWLEHYILKQFWQIWQFLTDLTVLHKFDNLTLRYWYPSSLWHFVNNTLRNWDSQLLTITVTFESDTGQWTALVILVISKRAHLRYMALKVKYICEGSWKQGINWIFKPL